MGRRGMGRRHRRRVRRRHRRRVRRRHGRRVRRWHGRRVRGRHRRRVRRRHGRRVRHGVRLRCRRSWRRAVEAAVHHVLHHVRRHLSLRTAHGAHRAEAGGHEHLGCAHHRLHGAAIRPPLAFDVVRPRAARDSLVPLASAGMCDSRPVRMVCWLSVTDAAPRTFFEGATQTAGGPIAVRWHAPAADLLRRIRCVVKTEARLNESARTHSKNTRRGNHQFSAFSQRSSSHPRSQYLWGFLNLNFFSSKGMI